MNLKKKGSNAGEGNNDGVAGRNPDRAPILTAAVNHASPLIGLNFLRLRAAKLKHGNRAQSTRRRQFFVRRQLLARKTSETSNPKPKAWTRQHRSANCTNLELHCIRSSRSSTLRYPGNYLIICPRSGIINTWVNISLNVEFLIYLATSCLIAKKCQQFTSARFNRALLVA